MLINQIDVIEEVKQNFLDSSYDVNANRAFPNVRDGLKPGQRACIWEMWTKKYTSNKPHVKSAKIDGGVAALWWPHGTTAIYETFARMSQPFTNNIPEVDFHGANGNIILGSDALAADRYCLTGDAKIITSYGIMPIEDLQQYTKQDNETLPKDFLIQDYNGDFVHADKFFNSGVHPVKEIVLQNGQSIKGTDNHPVVVLSGGGLGWKRIDQLSIFDKIAVPVFSPKTEINTDKDTGPLEAKMLGAMISEGCITTQNRIGITNQDINLVVPVRDFLQTQGIGLNASIHYRESDKTYNFYVSAKDYYSTFIEKYDYKEKADKKIVPLVVFCQDEQYKSTFLKYLFEGDGSVILNEKKREFCVSYSTYSFQLAKDVQILLLSLGIFCSINKSKKSEEKTEYKVQIRGYDIIPFEKYVNFVSDRKRDKLHNCVKIQNTKNTVSNNSYRYCPEISNLVQRKMPKEKQSTGFGNLYSIWKAQPYLDDYTFSRLLSILTDYVFVSIKSIEQQQDEMVYSVRVMNENSDHSYIANGIINHNTEARLAKITEDGMLYGINKNNVPMLLNFSEDEEWPQYLPAVFPRLLVNGCQGIGVSLANVWIPHNFTETANLILNYIKNDELDEDNYFPDFPTGGTIVNKDELSIINKTGKGRVVVEANYTISNNEINFYEMPYQVYINAVIEKIKERIDEEELTGISGVFNKSDKKKISLVVECQKGEDPEKIVEQLFDLTPLRSQYNVNQNGIISKTPVLLNLKNTIDVYLKHNLECIKREFEFEKNKTAERIEILESLIIALEDIDNVIQIIKTSANTEEAIKNLCNKYSISSKSAKAITDMKLARLTRLDGIKLSNELSEQKEYYKKCAVIVDSKEKQESVLVERLSELVKKYGDKRRTNIIQKTVQKKAKNGTKQPDPIESIVVTYNPLGYLQRIPLSNYRTGNYKSFKITTADFIILFSNYGKFYRISAKDIKPCGVKDKGTAIGSIIKLDLGEKIIAVFDSILNEKKPYILFSMKNGYIKKTEKIEYISTTRNLNGMIATKLKDTEIVSIQESNGDDVILTTEKNYKIRFNAEEVRATGKTSMGVKGISLQDNDFVKDCLLCSEKDYPEILRQKRAGKGKLYA